MASFVATSDGFRGVRGLRAAALLSAAALAANSCVPIAEDAASASFISPPDAAPTLAAFAAPTRAPLFVGHPATAFTGRTPLDSLRALDCLAQAVYYEAGAESADGQRAVAQVVLNRVRHPAFPNSVCGVVYQGPLRAGGGCQFTFTCDGSLARRPASPAWAEARRIAVEALAGRVFAPVGLSTHYHADYVSPSWAPRLVATTAIGAHDFYRMPGAAGEARAFTAAYAGREPEPRPAAYTPRRATPTPGLAALFPAPPAPAPAIAAISTAMPHIAATTLPESTVRDEYRHSGQWRADAPAAITGAH